MPKTKISEFSSTPASNTDIDSINIAENCPPSGINDAIRELMAQLKDWQSGTSNDPYVVGSSGSLTLNQGTANGVAYLNGSKVVTSGSALTFDGANIIVNATTPAYFTGTSNLAQVSINRSPSTGAIFNASQSAAYLNIDGASGGSSFQFVVASAANTQPSEQMRLTSTGLGIGTSSPAYKLDVNGVTRLGAGSPAILAGVGGAFASGQGELYTISTNNLGIGTTGAASLRFYTNSNLQATLDTSGNLGLGVTPSAWAASQNAFQIGNAGAINSSNSSQVILSANRYYANSGDRYINTAFASLYQQVSGQHQFYTAPSGTAGNAITFSQAMTLDSSGNLLVGTTSANGKLTVSDTSNTKQGLTVAVEVYQAAEFTNNTNGFYVTAVHNKSTSGTALFTSFGTEGSFTERGSITYNRAGGLTVYNTTSDYRAKDISGPVTGSGALIDSVPVYMGKMKDATQERPMFIAHETPEYAHTGVKDAVDEDGNPIYQQMDASALIPVMWAELQSLRKRLADANL